MDRNLSDGLGVERVASDVNMVADTHNLSPQETARLRRVVVGAIRGNRDRPVFLLARVILAAEEGDIFKLITPRASCLSKFDTALLDFIGTAAAQTDEGFTGLSEEVRNSGTREDALQRLTARLSSLLHGYRTRMLPDARHHNVFTAIRRFLGRKRPDDLMPRDGDAPEFWASEASRSFLTKYLTALSGLADFEEAGRLALSWRRSVALEDPAALALTEEMAAEATSSEEGALESYLGALDEVASAPIKILLGHERNTLSELAAHASVVERWPCSVIAGAAFSPVQAVITQASRRNGDQVDPSAHMVHAQPYAEICAQHDQLFEKLEDCLHLMHLCTLPPDETASARSKLSTERRKRIDAMMRRQSFVALEEASREEHLKQLVAPLVQLHGMLHRYVDTWKRLDTERRDLWELEHRKLFSEKFRSLYASES